MSLRISSPSPDDMLAFRLRVGRCVAVLPSDVGHWVEKVINCGLRCFFSVIFVAVSTFFPYLCCRLMVSCADSAFVFMLVLL